MEHSDFPLEMERFSVSISRLSDGSYTVFGSIERGGLPVGGTFATPVGGNFNDAITHARRILSQLKRQQEALTS